MKSQRIFEDEEVGTEAIREVYQKLDSVKFSLTEKITPEGKQEYRELTEKLSQLEGSHAW